MNEKRRRANALMKKYYSGLIDEGSWKTAAGDIVVFNTKYRRDLKSLVVQLEPIQAGSGDPSPDNIRPISGRTGATVYHTGKNIYDKNAVNPLNGYVADSYLASNGNIITNTSWDISEYIEINISNIILSTTAGYSPSICFYDANKDYISGIQYQYRNTVRISAPASAKYARVSVPKSGIDDFRLAYGSNIVVTWSSEVGTVYGGSLDVVSGELTVTHGFGLLNDPDLWAEAPLSQTINYQYNYQFSDRKKFDDSFTGLICSYYNVQRTTPENTARWAGAASNVFGIKSSIVTLNDIKAATANNEIEICYLLVNPQTYQLTPQQIQSLIGENVIWSDAGPVSVEYWS